MLYDIERFYSSNFESRNDYKPQVIVNHITDGENAIRDNDQHEESAVHNTFMNPSSESSAHFVICRDGRIKQYVDIGQAAWTQGLHSRDQLKQAPSPIVRQMGTNPNLYCVSKEFIAYSGAGGDGSITEEQFWAGVWLDSYIQDQVQQIYGHKIPLNSTYCIGHCHIDPVTRKNDPGRNFPWSRYFVELAAADNMSLQNYEGRIQYLRSDKFKVAQCVSIMNEIDYLMDCSDGAYGEGVKQWALGLFRMLYTAFSDKGLLPDNYTVTNDYKGFRNDVLYIYNCAIGKESQEVVDWGRGELAKVYPFMLQSGLVA